MFERELVNMRTCIEEKIRNPAASYFPMTLAIIVSSALKGLTSVFGMGTGASPSASPPETYCKKLYHRQLWIIKREK